ncbi:MAG: GGDEF domain-containing protein [Candidatus Omnitrophica bacterium]|nr:GGDEF domain-containing protein [Candidatus Omnitrophota bacterium]
MSGLKFTKFEKFLSQKINPNFPFVVFILFLFIVLQLLVRGLPFISVYSGYFYTIIIALAAMWFNIEGGFLTATLAADTYLYNLKITRGEAINTEIINSIYIIFLIFYSCGITVGYVSGKENRLKNELKKLAQYDELTGCLNFRWTMELLTQEILRSKRYGRCFSITLLDIDHFKKINDTYGHLVGNDILKTFSDSIKSNIRETDLLGRYGGEEFLIILPETDTKTTLIILERIKEKLKNIKIESPYLKEIIEFTLKFSAGVALFPDNGKDAKILICMADHALYQAKNLGRDRFLIEKRKALRFKPTSGLKIILKTIDTEGKLLIPLDILDLSKTGLQLLLKENLNELNEVQCKITFTDNNSAETIKLKLVHTLKTVDGLYQSGFCFINPPPNFQAKLLKTAKDS